MVLIEEQPEPSLESTLKGMGEEDAVKVTDTSNLRVTDIAATTSSPSIQSIVVDAADTGRSKSGDKKSGWRELMGSDLMIKTITPAPEGAASIQPHDAVVIDLVGRYCPASQRDDSDSNDPTNRPIFHDANNWLIVIGEKDVLPVLELGVRFMHVGETAWIWSESKYAYGPTSRQQPRTTGSDDEPYELPPDSCVRYQVTVKQVVPSEPSTPDFVISLAKSKKNIGNDIYNHEWIEGLANPRALQQYQRSFELVDALLENPDGLSPEQVAEAEETRLDALNNIAAVYMRAKQYHKAKEAAVKVLTVDPDNVKALLRAAKAALLDPASSYEEVEAALQAAAAQCQADPSDVNKLRELFQRRQAEYKKRTKAMYAKMGKAMGTKKDVSSTTTATVDDVASAPPEGRSNGDLTEDQNLDEEEEDEDNVEPDATATEPVTSFENATPPWWRRLDWRGTVLPYGIQLIMPFIVYYTFTVLKKKEQEILMAQNRSHGGFDEF